MIPEKISRYLTSAAAHPDRTLIALFSELTRIPVCVDLHMAGEESSFVGMLPEAISRYLYLMEGIRDYEPETQIMMRKIINSGDTVLIAGAHIGTHTIKAKQLTGVEGVVVGFEPSPDTFRMLRQNSESRGIVAEPVAIANHGTTEITMTIFDTRHSAWNSGANARSHNFNKWNPKTVAVSATTLDAYCEGHKLTPNVLILDLENGEMDALLGGENIIRSALPSIIIECGDLGREDHNSTNACLSLLESWGYELHEVSSQSGDLIKHQLLSSYPDDFPNVLALPRSKYS